MYKNGKSSYQVKKEKLQKIKRLLIDVGCEIIETAWDYEREEILLKYQEKLWEIVKDE